MRINEIAPKTNLNCSLYYKREKEGLLGRHKGTAVHFRSVNVDLLCKAFLYCNNQLQPFSKLGVFFDQNVNEFCILIFFSFMFLDLTYIGNRKSSLAWLYDERSMNSVVGQKF